MSQHQHVPIKSLINLGRWRIAYSSAYFFVHTAQLCIKPPLQTTSATSNPPGLACASVPSWCLLLYVYTHCVEPSQGFRQGYRYIRASNQEPTRTRSSHSPSRIVQRPCPAQAVQINYLRAELLLTALAGVARAARVHHAAHTRAVAWLELGHALAHLRHNAHNLVPVCVPDGRRWHARQATTNVYNTR